MNTVRAETAFPSGQILQLVEGDITLETTDAIVNAANKVLQHGAGVAGAIVRRGGAIIQKESDRWVRMHGPVSHAVPAWTPAGALPCRFVIHAVGPVWGEGGDDPKLAAAVSGSLNVAESLSLSSLALPAISTGVFGFPKKHAARVILQTIRDYFSAHPESHLKKIRLVLFDAPTIEDFLTVWHDHFAA
jgi:O-acetyl-ADP-ribose deacetylase (regulator of RNase III)